MVDRQVGIQGDRQRERETRRDRQTDRDTQTEALDRVWRIGTNK